MKAGLPSAKAWLRGPFVCNSLSAMADSNSCALVIRLRKDKRVVALPRLKFLEKDLSCCLCTNPGDSIRSKEEDEEEALN